MKKIVIKIFIIFLLFIMIIIISNIIKNIDLNNNNDIIKISNNHINASFTSNDYIKIIKDSENNINKYKNQSLEQFSNSNYTPTCISKIDKILFINLKFRKDRLKQITNEFNKMGFPQKKLERIDAVSEKYNGHIGCCKSHIKAMDIIIHQKLKYTMVFEDDFVFTVSKQVFDDKINQFLNQYGDDWDIIQLASFYVKTEDTNIDDIKKVKRASTSSAYIINLKFAKTLRANLKESLKQMENEMREFNRKNNNVLKKKRETKYALDQNWYSLQRTSEWYLFKPYLGKQGGDAGNSSIMSQKIEGFTSKPIRIYQLKI